MTDLRNPYLTAIAEQMRTMSGPLTAPDGAGQTSHVPRHPKGVTPKGESNDQPA